MIARLALKLRIAAIDAADPTDRTDANDAIEPTDRHEPTEPTDRDEPIEPIDSAEFREPIDSSELCDHSDHFDPVTARILRGRRKSLPVKAS